MPNTLLEYVWLDKDGDFRSKVKVVSEKVCTVYDCPTWNFDGSSTGQSDGATSDLALHPVFCCKHTLPHMEKDTPCFLVLCDVLNQDGSYYDANKDDYYALFERHRALKPWYGFEQEYFLQPVFDSHPRCKTNNKSYCGVEYNHYGRDIALRHLNACIKAGLTVSGINAEVEEFQWEYQIGPVEGVEAAHQLMVSRFLLIREATGSSTRVDFTPKPAFTKQYNLNGSGCHTNFSTLPMRMKGGLKEVHKAIARLEAGHQAFMEVSGKGNAERMTGQNETSSSATFSFGLTNRGTSIRIPLHVVQAGEAGENAYFEDRRPGANCDPYAVAATLLAHATEPEGQ